MSKLKSSTKKFSKQAFKIPVCPFSFLSDSLLVNLERVKRNLPSLLAGNNEQVLYSYVYN